jgi:hypothetical protein
MTDLDKAYDIAERVFVVTNTQGKIFDEIVELIVQDTLDKAVARVESLNPSYDPYHGDIQWLVRTSVINRIRDRS